MNKALFIPIVFFLSIIVAKAQTSKGLHVTNTFHIASTGGWDFLEVGPVNNWLYVSHGTQVNVLNKITGDSVTVIENTIGVHDIAFDTENKKGFISNGKLNTVTVFDLNTNKVLAQIPTGNNPDAIIYDPFSKKIISCNGRSKNLSIIDPVNNSVTDSVYVGGKPECAVVDGIGHLFVNIEDKNEIVVVDTKTLSVIAHRSITPGKSPTGLAFDKKNNRLFSGCEKLLIISDAVTGNIVDTIPIGDGCDGVAFDEITNTVYASNGDGTLTVIQEENADKFLVTQNVITKKGARTIALDKQTHRIYLPTADFDATQLNEKGRPKMIPGTFQILIVDK